MKIVEETRKSRRKLGGLQRVNSFGNPRENCSITQFAIMDDDGISGVQTKGGTGLTLVSQWKSQFDDSEETTDNEWKQEKIQFVNPHQYLIPAPTVKYQSLQLNQEPHTPPPKSPTRQTFVENKQTLQISDIIKNDVINPAYSMIHKKKKWVPSFFKDCY